MTTPIADLEAKVRALPVPTRSVAPDGSVASAGSDDPAGVSG